MKSKQCKSSLSLKSLTFAVSWAFLSACSQREVPSDSEVKAETSEFDLYFIQTDITQDCCPKISDDNFFLNCVFSTAEKRIKGDASPAVAELNRRAATHNKTFKRWICGSGDKIETY